MWNIDTPLRGPGESTPDNAPLDRYHKSSEYLKQITGDDFLFSFAMNVNEQRIIAFLTEKCCYLNLQSKVCTQLR